ncbi:unnamed protein product [Lactuca saligna]|uniref:Uncharacterized protein n=1 Tax=Lactuca saligna TaxID=75948 RepID=A0AA36E1D4_LACSI|nr:unnamed protein product [Lactuca saligna]
MGSRVLLSAVLLSLCLTMNVFGDGVDDNVSWTQAPHHAPSYQPVAAPAPHHHHHHHKPGVGHHHKLASPPMAHAPTKAPVHAPVHPPTKAPVQAPTKAPVHPPSSSPAPFLAPIPARKLVAVQGVVYCKACKYKGVDTLLGATPLPGAEVLLTCNNTKYPLRVKDLHAGVKGSLLLPNKKPPLSSPDAHPLPYDVFSVGPFAFEPSSKTPCAKETIED